MPNKKQVRETEKEIGDQLRQAINGDFETWAEARDNFDRLIRCAQAIESKGLEAELKFELSIKIKVPKNPVPTEPLQ